MGLKVCFDEAHARDDVKAIVVQGEETAECDRRHACAFRETDGERRGLFTIRCTAVVITEGLR